MIAKGMKKILGIVLWTEANTVSCMIMYQPKTPEGLMNYRRNTNGKRYRNSSKLDDPESCDN